MSAKAALPDSLDPTTSPATSLAGTALGIPPAPGTAGAAVTCATVAGRHIRKFVRTPQLMVVATVQAALFLLIFRYVLGGAIDVGDAARSGGMAYVDFLVPGYVLSSVLFAGAGAAAGVAEDVEQGVSDRLHALPVARIALLAGRSVADTALLTWGLVVATVAGFLAGFRIHGSPAGALAAFGLCVLCGFAFTWLFICIGSLAGNAQTAQSLSMFVLPMTTVSSAIVPVQTMPTWMQPIADHQPVTIMTNAVRSLVLGGPDLAGLDHSTGYWVALALLWCTGLTMVFAPLAAGRYRRS